MKKADLDQVKYVVHDAVHEAIKPLRESHEELAGIVALHRQTLYGPTGENGLCGDMKTVKSITEDYKINKGKAAVLVAVAGSVFGAIGAVVTKLIRFNP
jgi:hypothetical protein